MRIVWDEPKRLTNLQKHELDFAALTDEWFERATIVPARDKRLKAVGWLDERTIVVIFFSLGTEAFSIISMRRAKPKERRLLR